jgi:hypothetical protein
LRECWLAREQLRVFEGRPIGRAEILTARVDAAAEAAKVPDGAGGQRGRHQQHYRVDSF